MQSNDDSWLHKANDAGGVIPTFQMVTKSGGGLWFTESRIELPGMVAHTERFTRADAVGNAVAVVEVVVCTTRHRWDGGRSHAQALCWSPYSTSQFTKGSWLILTARGLSSESVGRLYSAIPTAAGYPRAPSACFLARIGVDVVSERDSYGTRDRRRAKLIGDPKPNKELYEALSESKDFVTGWRSQWG